MTIRELRRLMRGLPLNMKVVVGVGYSLEDICIGNAGVTCIKYNDSNKKEYLLVLPECECKLQSCNVVTEGLNTKPELN